MKNNLHLPDLVADDCIHHPGQPVFHDAYKGWSCCNKKCIDFTEFLNIKGCTKAKHSNEKPPEPEKQPIDKSKTDEVIEVVSKSMNIESTLDRPPLDTPQLLLTPTISKTLLEQVQGLTALETKPVLGEVQIGQNCKNNTCKATYKGADSNEEACTFHPGVPIFHEGMKYWSCCRKKTTEFSVFLEQRGCSLGKHVWFSKVYNSHRRKILFLIIAVIQQSLFQWNIWFQDMGKMVQCRMDWHQTGAYVVVSVYAKKYLPSQSVVKLNSIRLTVDLFFIEENSRYNLDIELRGVCIDM